MAEDYRKSPQFAQAIRALADLDTTRLNFYDKAHYMLALGAAEAFLSDLSQDTYKPCIQLLERLRVVNSSFSVLMSSLLQTFLGLAALTFGITMIASGVAVPGVILLSSVGTLLTSHGLYKTKQNIPIENPVGEALTRVIAPEPERRDEEQVESYSI